MPRSRVAAGVPQALVAAGALEPDEYAEGWGEMDIEGAVERGVAAALAADRAHRSRAVMAVSALRTAGEADDQVRRSLAGVRAAEVFAMPAFIKDKIDKRKAKEEEEDCDDDDEDCKKRKADKSKPFGGKKAAPFGSK